MKLKIIALILGIAMLTAGLAYGHVVNGVTYTDRNASAQNIIGNNSDMYGNTMGNGRLQDVTCITNCTGYSGIGGSYNQTTNAGIYDANGWTGNITNSGFTLFGFHGTGNVGAGYGFYAGDGSSDPVLISSGSSGFANPATANLSFNTSAGKYSINMGTDPTGVLAVPFQAPDAKPSALSLNYSYNTSNTPNTASNQYQVQSQAWNYNSNNNVVAGFFQGVSILGNAWGINPVGITKSAAHPAIADETNYATQNESVGGGIQIIAGSCPEGVCAHTAWAVLIQNNDNRESPHNAIVLTSWDNTIDFPHPSATNGNASIALDNLIYIGQGAVDAPSPAQNINFQFGNVTNSQIIVPMNETTHTLEALSNNGTIFYYLDATSQGFKFRNGTADMAIFDNTTGNVSILNLRPTAKNQSILAADAVGNLTKYTPKYHDETANRAQATVYTNRAGTPITVIISFNQGTTAGTSIQVDSTDVALIGGASDVSTYKTLYAVVPAGSTYGTTGTGLTILHWNEVY